MGRRALAESRTLAGASAGGVERVDLGRGIRREQSSCRRIIGGGCQPTSWCFLRRQSPPPAQVSGQTRCKVSWPWSPCTVLREGEPSPFDPILFMSAPEARTVSTINPVRREGIHGSLLRTEARGLHGWREVQESGGPTSQSLQSITSGRCRIRVQRS